MPSFKQFLTENNSERIYFRNAETRSRCYLEPWQGGFYLSGVKSDVKGKGGARIVVQQACDYADAQHKKIILAVVVTDDWMNVDQLIKFYQSFGFAKKYGNVMERPAR